MSAVPASHKLSNTTGTGSSKSPLYKASARGVVRRSLALVGVVLVLVCVWTGVFSRTGILTFHFLPFLGIYTWSKAAYVSQDTIHQVAENTPSRQPGFRCTEFSETQSVLLLIRENPICRGNPIRSGPGLCPNSPTNFRCREFSEIELPRRRILGNWASD